MVGSSRQQAMSKAQQRALGQRRAESENGPATLWAGGGRRAWQRTAARAAQAPRVLNRAEL
eukprot:756441-Alexandrium_andersonii.AAC.1